VYSKEAAEKITKKVYIARVLKPMDEKFYMGAGILLFKRDVKTRKVSVLIAVEPRNDGTLYVNALGGARNYFQYPDDDKHPMDHTSYETATREFEEETRKYLPNGIMYLANSMWTRVVWQPKGR
jgi:hypothetical protein